MAEKTIKKGNKEKRVIPLRQAGVTVKDPNERPSKSLFDEVARQEAEQSQATSPTSRTLPTPLTADTPPTTPTPPKTKTPITASTTVAPTRDYQKVANSIVREAIPSGVFKGKSKLIYDCLYLLTRGAIVPKRAVRIPKKDLMKRAGIGSERTLLKNLAHLKMVRLLVITEFEGQHEGNEYEIFLPEEVGLDLIEAVDATAPTPPTAPQAEQSPSKVGTLPPVESEVTGVGLNTADTDISRISKTFFKDFEMNDDDLRAVALFLENLNETCQKVTGKSLTSKDFEKLSEEFTEIIANETILAAARAKSVSAFIPFMTENLRRRLYSKPRAAKFKTEERPSHLDVGKGSELSIAEPLGEARETVLESLRSLAEKNGAESLEIFRPNYTQEDWQWLINQLEIKKNNQPR